MQAGEKSLTGVLSKLPDKKLHLLLGEITSLLLFSKIHRKMQIRDIADIILPPVNLNQFRIYRDSKGKPVGLVTWGWFDDKTLNKYISGNPVLSEDEWNSGSNLFFADFIAPFGHARKIFKDLTHNIFPDEIAQTMRFTEQGKHRKKIIKLYGKNRKS